MQYVRALIESRPMLLRTPDKSILTSSSGEGEEHIHATRASDGSYAFIYIPTGRTISVAVDKISGRSVKASWYNPLNGETSLIREINTGVGVMQFDPPGEHGSGNDWVLILDDAEKGFTGP